MFSSVRKLAAMVAVAAIAACGGDGPAGPDGGPNHEEPGNVVGVWHVVRLNAKELPADASPGLTMSAGRLELAADDTYYMEMVYNGVARGESGTYEADLETKVLTLDPELDDSYSGLLDLNGDDLTAAIGGVTLEFEREGSVPN